MSSDARYCPFCGNRSTFYNDDLLPNWKEEIKAKEEDDAFQAQLEANGFLNIPDGINEELPFN